MTAIVAVVKLLWDVLVRHWDTFSADWDAPETARWLWFGFWCLLDALRRRRPKKRREITAHITFGAPTAAARVSTSPPDWL